jgi:hypothetical protein
MRVVISIIVTCILLLLPCRNSSAREWYEPSLTISNKTADTAKCDADLHQLLTYYQRLAETEPQLWVTYYYQAFINLKLAENSRDPKIKQVFLERAWSTASLSLLNFEHNDEIKALYAYVAIHAIEENCNENLVLMNNSIGELIDTVSDNPRMVIAYATYLFKEPEKNRDRIRNLQSKLKEFTSEPEIYFRGDAFHPSWGTVESRKLLAAIGVMK